MKAARDGRTTKLTRRRKRRRRELATKAEAVGGRVQRLVVLLLGRFARRLPRTQSTLKRAEAYQPQKPKSRARAATPRHQKLKTPRENLRLSAAETPTLHY